MCRKTPTFLLTLAPACVAFASSAQMPAPASYNSAKDLAPGVLSREQSAAILPQTVFFRRQTATIQQRNSSGIMLSDGKLVLFALVDAAGYASALQQTYQEVSLNIGDQTLRPGAYSFGFLEDNRVVVMDIGGNEVLHSATTRDTALARPTPLQVLADPATSLFRLYVGRSYVTVGPATN